MALAAAGTAVAAFAAVIVGLARAAAAHGCPGPLLSLAGPLCDAAGPLLSAPPWSSRAARRRSADRWRARPRRTGLRCPRRPRGSSASSARCPRPWPPWSAASRRRHSPTAGAPRVVGVLGLVARARDVLPGGARSWWRWWPPSRWPSGLAPDRRHRGEHRGGAADHERQRQRRQQGLLHLDSLLSFNDCRWSPSVAAAAASAPPRSLLLDLTGEQAAVGALGVDLDPKPPMEAAEATRRCARTRWSG